MPGGTLNTEHELDYLIDEDEPPYEPCILFGDVVLCGWAEEDLVPNPDGLPIRHDRGYEVLFADGKQTSYQPPGGRQRKKPKRQKQRNNPRPSFDSNSRFSGGRFPDFPRR